MNGIVSKGPTTTRDLVMDGNISAQFLNNYDLTLDLQHARMRLSPVPGTARARHAEREK